MDFQDQTSLLQTLKAMELNLSGAVSVRQDQYKQDKNNGNLQHRLA